MLGFMALSLRPRKTAQTSKLSRREACSSLFRGVCLVPFLAARGGLYVYSRCFLLAPWGRQGSAIINYFCDPGRVQELY